MASKETNLRKEEARQIFNEVHQIAYAGASPIMREALEKYRARYNELTERKKNGGEKHEADQA
jgi:hypothetical protein